MDNNALPQTAKPQDLLTGVRRSTRINFDTTVLLSGKDGSGTPFQEYTQTAVVSLHGCRVRTSYQILIGMLVTLECPKSGASGKGVCVKVWDSPPGVAGHEIAIQLIKPQNLWGVTNPPADWEMVAKTLKQGRRVQTETPARPATPVAPRGAARVLEFPRTPAIPPTVAPVVALRETPVPPTALAGPPIEPQIAELERRSTQLVGSVLDSLRTQAEEFMRSSLEEFRQQLNVLIQDSEVRLRQGLQQTYEESADSLIGLRKDLMEQMASRAGQMIRSAEDTLRTRPRSQMPVEDEAAPIKPPEPVTKK